jgi:hypothetical protein
MPLALDLLRHRGIRACEGDENAVSQKKKSRSQHDAGFCFFMHETFSENPLAQ